MIEIAVTDTHALIWYAQARWHRLGREARGVFQRADDGAAVIYIPTLVLAEVAEAVHRGSVRLVHGFAEWTGYLFDSRRFVPVELSVDIVLRAEVLYAIPERGDRLIAATAAHLGYPLLTRDAEIGGAAGVEVVW